MDIIYTDSTGADVGIIQNYDLDFDIGDTEDFEIKLPYDAEILDEGCFLYAVGSEVFGIVDGFTVNSEERSMMYHGRTIRGIMNKKIIEPLVGEDYKVLNGNLADICNELSDSFGISTLVRFISSEEYEVRNYKVDRYVSFLAATEKILKQFNAKMLYHYDGTSMQITIVPSVDYSDDIEYRNNNTIQYVLEHQKNVNHLICLGKGDLVARQVIHLYADSAGNVSKVQTMFGISEISDVYDYPSAESLEELEKSGIKKLSEYQMERADVTVSAQKETVGDIVGTRDSVTGKVIKGTITSKVIKVKNNVISIKCKVG